MDLIIFDLDGTLLNRNSLISEYTSETLKLLSEREIAYTVATGRTLHGAKGILDGHRFDLPHAYKNGVMIWYPELQQFSNSMTLTASELENVVQDCLHQGLTPFVFTLDTNHQSTVYYPALQSEADQVLVEGFCNDSNVTTCALEELPSDANVTHINSIGAVTAIDTVMQSIGNTPQLVAYSGVAIEGAQWHWIDIHHSGASKGIAIEAMKELLGYERVICFGDSDNDLSMFEIADECYATANANDAIKSIATAVIGHHDEDGVAKFLRERFSLDVARS
ncbi:MAG: Cof subfamily protein (haloacid dehalogenase superfamily) [Gammaproteobacteria bacterium]|jgi:Cof subfamily protein (haloacid dehalogenase superfamily)